VKTDYSTRIRSQYRNDFRERRIWRARLITYPSRVLVPDDGRSVVTIDNGSCGSGREHTVVVYGERGRIVANLRLQDILTEKEIREKVSHAVSGPDWIEKASFSFERSTPRVDTIPSQSPEEPSNDLTDLRDLLRKVGLRTEARAGRSGPPSPRLRRAPFA
jgi:hypothetical protein